MSTGQHASSSHRRAQQRREELLDMVRARGEVNVAELPSLFGVSAETVRRDLRVLEERHSIIRSYGNVRAAESGSFETNLSTRQGHRSEEKYRIARAAAERVGDARIIFVDEGFLPSLFGSALPQDRELTIVTSSLPVATELSSRELTEVIMLGGRVRGKTLGVVDAFATEMLRGLAIDLAFVGANGVTADGWLSTPDPSVAAVKGLAVQMSARRVLIAGHYKFGLSTFARFAHVREFEAIVTGRELASGIAGRYAALGPTVVRA